VLEIVPTVALPPTIPLTCQVTESFVVFARLAVKVCVPVPAVTLLVAGHSMGEYTALLAAGAWSLTTALQVVRARGEAMQDAASSASCTPGSRLPMGSAGEPSPDSASELSGRFKTSMTCCAETLTETLEAVRMAHAARAFGLGVMLGCMIESSLAITAAAHLTPLVDYADLDGNLLIENDPYEGVRVEQGKLVLPDEAGLGVRKK